MQLHVLSSILFGISANVDSFVVGLSYGIKKASVSWFQNLLVGFICFAGTLGSMLLGRGALFLLPKKVSGTAGGLLIVFMGLAGLIQYLRRNSRKKETKDLSATALNYREVFLVGFALCINNMGLGIGAGVTGLPVPLTALFSLCFSMLFFYLGNRLGFSRLPQKVNQYAEPFADLLMVLLGVYEILV